MAKCLVCNKIYSDDSANCPRCGFENLVILGDYDEGLRRIQPKIDAYRREFYKDVVVSIVACSHKDENDMVVLDKEPVLDFGTADQLIGKTKWIPDELARAAEDIKKVPVRLRIKARYETHNMEIPVRNLTETERQQIGIKVDKELNTKLQLKNSKTQTESAPFGLLEW